MHLAAKAAVRSNVVVLLLLIRCIPGFCNCSKFCCTLLYVYSSFVIILMGNRELVALLSSTSWCLVISFTISYMTNARDFSS